MTNIFSVLGSWNWKCFKMQTFPHVRLSNVLVIRPFLQIYKDVKFQSLTHCTVCWPTGTSRLIQKSGFLSDKLIFELSGQISIVEIGVQFLLDLKEPAIRIFHIRINRDPPVLSFFRGSVLPVHRKCNWTGQQSVFPKRIMNAKPWSPTYIAGLTPQKRRILGLGLSCPPQKGVAEAQAKATRLSISWTSSPSHFSLVIESWEMKIYF